MLKKTDRNLIATAAVAGALTLGAPPTPPRTRSP